MELKDFIVTPVVLFIVYILAYIIRPKVTDQNTRRYFISALTVKIIGAIAVGLIYQFYYGGGDTFAYHTHGSRIIWRAFIDEPSVGLKLIFSDGEYQGSTFKYASKIWYYRDMKSFFVIRIAAIFDIITFSSYASTAVFFACLSFSGIWALYYTFYQKRKELHYYLALGVLFVPSVFFWGSGILKDTITLGALGWATFIIDQIFFRKRNIVQNVILLLFSMFIIFSVKIYILLCFIPAVIIWIYAYYMKQINSLVLKLMLAPVILSICIVIGYFAIEKVGEAESKYAIDNIAETARETAYDIRYGWGARDGTGSGYTLGELDGTLSGMLKLMPAAINVSLFRPYLWEVNNPLMLLAALESIAILILTIVVIVRTRLIGIFRSGTEPVVFFCLTFALVFAFAVGVSTFNFGTLMRYKIPLLPFYTTALVFILHHSNKARKLSRFEDTE